MKDDSYALADVEGKLDSLIDKVSAGARIELKKEGKSAYLVSEDDLLALSAMEDDFIDGWVDEAAQSFCQIGYTECD